MRRLLCLLLAAALLSSLLCASALSGTHERVVLGADLNEEQIGRIYQDFGVERGSMRELTVQHAEEQELLGGILDGSAIGSASYSCVYVKLLEDGSGCQVERHNIDWCTEEMYRCALSTAGIRDVHIIVSAPFPVSGTCALVGIYKAYEDITGETLETEVKALGVEELLLTGQLSEEIGSSYDAAGIMEELKDFLQGSETLSDEELTQRIHALAQEHHVHFSDGQAQQLLELCRKLEELEKLNMGEKLEGAQQFAEKLHGWQEKTREMLENWQETREKLGKFSEKLSQWGSGIRESWQSVRQHTRELQESWKELFGKEPEED